MAEDYVWIPWDSIVEYCEHVKPIRDVIPEFYLSLSPSQPEGGHWQLSEPTVDNKVYSLETDITPVQSGTGDPSPDNVRPISGWSEVKVTRTGKNLIAVDDYSVSLNNGYYYDKNTAYKPKGSIDYALSLNIVDVQTPFIVAAGLRENESGIYNRDISQTVFQAAGRVEKSFASPSSDVLQSYPYFSYRAPRYGYPTTTSADISNVQLEIGTTATSYEPYQGTDYTIPLGQTVYGGKLNVTTGELTVTHGRIKSNDWTAYAHSNGYTAYSLSGVSKSATRNDGIVSNALSDFGSFSSATMDKNIIQLPRNNDMAYLALKDDSAITAADIEVVYELATPYTIQLTPTEVTLLLGTNNIWSDTGENTHILTADDEQTGAIVTVYGKTLWMRNHIFYKDGSDEYTTPVRIG